MNHQISNTIGEDPLKRREASLSIDDFISQLKANIQSRNWNNSIKDLNFSDLEQAVKAIVDDIKG